MTSLYPDRRGRIVLFLGFAGIVFVAGLSWALVPQQVRPGAGWRADHHIHLASVELCRLVGECLESNDPPAVYATDAIRVMDESQVGRGVILSCAYLFGLPSLRLSPELVAAGTRRENEWTAIEVAKYPARLVGFLSVNPLQASAIDEIRHWKGSRELIGLKLHFTASDVHLRNPAELAQVARVVAAAAAQQLPMVIHIGGGEVNGADAERFIQTVLPSAGSSWVQIAHAGGGLPLKGDDHLQVLRAFARHIAAEDPVTRHLLFDLSYVPAPEETDATAAALGMLMRSIGIRRFLFASDYNVLTPGQQISALDRLGLTPDELQILRENCAPWAC